MLFIFKKNEDLGAILSNDLPESCPYFADELREVIEDGFTSLEFDCPGDHADSAQIEVEGYVGARRREGGFHLLKIREVVEDRGEDGKVMLRVYAENSALELLGTVIRPTVVSSQTVEQSLDLALFGTRWEPGIVEWFGTRSYEFDKHTSSLAALHAIATQYGAELRFRVEIQQSKVVGRYVDLLQRRGTDNGIRFEYEKNIKSILRKESTEQLVTALVGVGSAEEVEDGEDSSIDFSDVVWSKAAGDPADKPAGQDWIGDPDALQKWGTDGRHIVGVYESQAQTPERLLTETWRQLQDRKDPRVSYEMGLLLLEELTGYEQERIQLGDTVIVKDTSFARPTLLSARVIDLVASSDPGRSRAVLANFIPLTSTIQSVVTDLQRTIQANRAKWASSGETIHKDPQPPENPTADQLWLDTSVEPNVLKRHTGTGWAKATPTEAEEVGAITPVQAQDLTEVERLRGHKVVIYQEKSAIDDRHGFLVVRTFPTASVKTELQNAKTNYDSKYSELVQAIDAAVADGQLTQTERTNVESKTEAYRLAVARYEKAFTSAQDNVADGKAAAAEASATDFTETYANKKIAQGSASPSNPVTGDLWIDTSSTPHIWKRWSGSAWVNAVPTQASHVGAATVEQALAQAEAEAAKAVEESQTFTESYANKKVSQSNTAPSSKSTGDLWIDTSKTPHVWMRWNGSAWVKATPTTAGEVGAETPSGAQSKADAAKAAAESAAKTFTETYANKQISQSNTAPGSPATGDLWIDTSKNPHVWMRWNGSAWVKATPTTAAEVGAETPAAAQAKADAAKSAAEAAAATYAEAQAEAARVAAEAHADGKVSTEEQARIDQAAANLAEAKQHADTKAEEARQAAEAAAALDAQSKADAAKVAAETAAKTYTETYANKKVTQSNTAPSSKVTGDLWINTSTTPHVWMRWNGSAWVKATPTTAAEVGAETPAAAQAKADAAKAAAESAANTFTESYANKKITQASTAPSSKSTGDLWINTSTTPHVWMRWNGSAWIKATPTTAAEVGAETPAAAQAKADAAKAAAEAAAATYAEAQAEAARVAAEAHADGKVSAEEQARIDQAAANLAEAKSHADTKAAAAESAAKAAAAIDAQARAEAEAAKAKTAAESAAKSYTETYANKKVTQSNTAPSSKVTGDLWIDTSKNPHVWMRWNGSAWVKATVNAFGELTGTISANQIATNTITSGMIATAGLDAGVIKTGVLDAGRVKIGSGTTFDSGFDPTKIEIGGRNLFLGSGDFSGWGTKGSGVTVLADKYLGAQVSRVVNAWTGKTYSIDNLRHLAGTGLDYVVSFYAKADFDTTGIAHDINAYGFGGAIVVCQWRDLSSDWKQFHFTTKSTAFNSSDSFGFRVESTSSTPTGGYLYFSGFKIEKGTKPTDWSPAPEDVNQSIGSAEAAAKSHADSQAAAAQSAAISAAASDATSKANAAQSAAQNWASNQYSGTKTLVDGWKYSNTTFIDGGDIYTGTVTANQVASRTLLANHIKAGEITANELKTGIITSDYIAAAGLDAGVVKFGTMSGERIQARTISTTQLTITDFTNLCENPDFEDDVAGSSPRGWSETSIARVVDISGWNSGNGSRRALQIDGRASGNADVYARERIPVRPGQELFLSADARYFNTNGSGQARIGFRTYDGSGNHFAWMSALVWEAAGSASMTNFTTKSGGWTVPSNVESIQIWVSFQSSGTTSNSLIVDNIQVRKKSDANLIVNGAIKSQHISSNTITSEMISTAGLDAGVVKTGVLDARRVRIGSGTTFDTNFDPTTKETPAGAQSKANAAQSAAISTASSDATTKANAAESSAKSYADTQYSGTKTLVEGWKYGNTTYIDGGDIYTNTITANQIASRTITANQIATGTLSSDLIVTAGLDAAVVKFGTMHGNRIAAGTIATDRLTTGLNPNIVRNGYDTFAQLPTGSGSVTTLDASTFTIVTGMGFSSNNRLQCVNGGGLLGTSSTDYNTPLEAGKTYIVSGYTRRELSATYENRIGIKFSNGTQVHTSQSFTGYTGWNRIWHKFTVPSGVTAGVVYVWSSATWFWDAIMVEEVSPSTTEPSAFKPAGATVIHGGNITTDSITATQIASGSISTDLISTSGLDAAVIKFGTMSGSRIASNTITATQIASNTITATQIAGNTITASQIASRTITASQIATGTLTTDLISTAGLDAGVIKTGTLDAGRVRIGSGTAFDSNYDPTTKETPSGAQSKASAAQSAAISTAASDATSKANAARDAAILYTDTSTGNLVNNPAVTGNANRWSSTSLATQDFHGVTGHPVLQSSVSSNTQHYSDYFDVDPSKAYEVSVWVRKSVSTGRIYLGLNCLNATGSNTGITSVNMNGTVATTTNTNPYFWSTGLNNSPTAWTRIVAYIMPAGTAAADLTDAGDIPDAGGTRSNMIMRGDIRRIRLRFLNWENDTTRQVWVANPRIQEVDAMSVIRATKASRLSNEWQWGDTTEINGGNIRTNTITANKINVSTLSALSANLGTVTAGTLRTVNLEGATGTFSGSLTGQEIVIDSDTSSNHSLKIRMSNASGSSTKQYATLTSMWSSAGGTELSIGGVNTITLGAGTIYTNAHFMGNSTSFSGDVRGGSFTVGTSNTSLGTQDLTIQNKVAVRGNDAWLRLNPTNSFSSGIYCNTSTLRTDGTLQVGSSSQFLAQSNGNVRYSGTLSTTSSETGYFGMGARQTDTTTLTIAGQGVNFRAQKTYTPSSVSISEVSSIGGVTTPTVSDITVHGFYAYISGTGSTGSKAWRGHYTA